MYTSPHPYLSPRADSPPIHTSTHPHLPPRADTPPIHKDTSPHLSPRADTPPTPMYTSPHPHLSPRADTPPIHRDTTPHLSPRADTPPTPIYTSPHPYPTRADTPPIHRDTAPHLSPRADTPPNIRHTPPHPHLSPRADTPPIHTSLQHLPSRADTPPIRIFASPHLSPRADTPPIPLYISSHPHLSPRADTPPILTSHPHLSPRADTPPVLTSHPHLSPRADTPPVQMSHPHLPFTDTPPIHIYPFPLPHCPSRADTPPILRPISPHPHLPSRADTVPTLTSHPHLPPTDSPPVHRHTSSHPRPSRTDTPPIHRRNPPRPQQDDGCETVDYYADSDTEPERVRRGAPKRALPAGRGFLRGARGGEARPGGGSFLGEGWAGLARRGRPTRRKGLAAAGRERSRCDRRAGERGRAPTRRGAAGERGYPPGGLAEDDPLVQPEPEQPSPLIRIPQSAAEGYKVFPNFSVTASVHQASAGTCRCGRAARMFGRLEQQGSPPWDGEPPRPRGKVSPVRNILDFEFIHFSRSLQRISRPDPPRHPGIFPCGPRGGGSARRGGKGRGGPGCDETGSPLTVTISRPVTTGGWRRPGNNDNNNYCNTGPQQPLTSGEGTSGNTGAGGRDWLCEGATAAAMAEAAASFHQAKDHNSRCKRRWVAPHSQAPSRGGVVGGAGGGEEQDQRWSKKPRCSRGAGPRPGERRREGALGEKRNWRDPSLCPMTDTDHCSFHRGSHAPRHEPWKASYRFYVYQTDADPFFQEVKDFLKKEGHVEISLLDLAAVHPHQSGKVLVIIRNKDVETHLHQIPSLLGLKRMQCVQFAAVDSLRDLKDQTYRELFTSGGFIVSDGNVLDKITPEHLQQICDLLEAVGSESEWKWMVHYRELKRLKEFAREDSEARWKLSLLTRNLEANIVEVLPFHGCDSKFQTKYDYLDCLINLQVQRISSRFAVFLSGKPENREVFAQNGIVVMDVNNFTKDLRILTTHLQSTLVTENAIEDED